MNICGIVNEKDEVNVLFDEKIKKVWCNENLEN
jgi:hypothetical protein